MGKQFEIATLLVVREILKRLSEIKFSDELSIDDDLLLLLAECAAFLALFYTSLSYHRIASNNENTRTFQYMFPHSYNPRRG